MSGPGLTNRRPVITALAALVGVGIVCGGIYELSAGRHPTGADSDLLAGLGDRDAAARVGASVLADSAGFEPHQASQNIRARMHNQSLAALVEQDAREGRLFETAGWVLPDTVAQLCALSAKSG